MKFGATYELQIDNLEIYDPLDYRNYVAPKCTVTREEDNQKPIWNCEPTYLGKSYDRNGTLSSDFVYFGGATLDTLPVLVYAKVTNQKTYRYRYFYVPFEEKNIIVLGDGDCSANFLFKQGTNYTVEFGLLDASGNESSTLTPPITFTAPNETDSDINSWDLKYKCGEVEPTSKAIANITNISPGNPRFVLILLGIFVGLGFLSLIVFAKLKVKI